MKLNIGDKVTLKDDISWVVGDYNPVWSIYKIAGTIVNIYNGTVKVKWDNGKTNSYYHKDLTLHLPFLDVLDDI